MSGRTLVGLSCGRGELHWERSHPQTLLPWISWVWALTHQGPRLFASPMVRVVESERAKLTQLA